jgi:hypothetical protein
LRFAITFPPSGCEEDFHLQAVKYARHTMKTAGRSLPCPGKIKIYLVALAAAASAVFTRAERRLL